MRHLRAGRKLGMTSSHRAAMMRNMVTSLLDHERIVTTDTRAKELRKIADRMITLGKRGDLHARRLAARLIREERVAAKLFAEIAPRFSEINGGYTRIVKVGRRNGDNAPMAIIELTRQAEVADSAAKKKKRKKEKGE